MCDRQPQREYQHAVFLNALLYLSARGAHRKREWKLSNLKTEIEKIKGKEAQEGGLTSGQAATLVSPLQSLASRVLGADERPRGCMRPGLGSMVGASSLIVRRLQAAIANNLPSHVNHLRSGTSAPSTR